MEGMVMAIEGVDLSWARPGGAALVAASKHFVVRYLTGTPGKPLTAAEVADYHGHGLKIALVFETSKGRALDGHPAGVADGQSARNAAAARGVPPAVPIYFAVDIDASADKQPAIDAYLKGAGSVVGRERVGVYGGLRVVTRCHDNGTARWFWQTYAWSGGKIAPFIHLYQYRNGQTINHGAVDFCRAYRANFGQWPQPADGQPDPVSGQPQPAAAGQHYRVVISGGPVRLYTGIQGNVIGAVTLATYECTRSKHDGSWWYSIVHGKRSGQAFRPNHFTIARYV
jgi:hypothetical protein